MCLFIEQNIFPGNYFDIGISNSISGDMLRSVGNYKNSALYIEFHKMLIVSKDKNIICSHDFRCRFDENFQLLVCRNK